MGQEDLQRPEQLQHLLRCDAYLRKNGEARWQKLGYSAERERKQRVVQVHDMMKQVRETIGRCPPEGAWGSRGARSNLNVLAVNPGDYSAEGRNREGPYGVKETASAKGSRSWMYCRLSGGALNRREVFLSDGNRSPRDSPLSQQDIAYMRQMDSSLEIGVWVRQGSAGDLLNI